jgi:ABC-type nitrate/sulfonate/bicarbonate transport system ATPase subunit
MRHWFGEDLSPETLRRSVGSLSDGERQRVVLAAEVMRLDRIPGRSPLRLLLLDEPFGALDPPAHLRLMDALLGWLRGSTLRSAVLVSHSPVVDLGLARAFGVPATEWIIGEEAA